MANLTIKDIARMAGVSTTAVSFVLNDRPGVSEATRKKVQQIIRQTDFIPNVHTRRLNLGKSFTIHVVLRKYSYSLFNQFALETLSGIFAESKALGYSIMFTFADENTESHQIIESVRKTGKVVLVSDACARGSYLNYVAQNITTLCFDDLDAPPVVVGAKNWITPPYEFDEFFFPQAGWILDSIHEKIVPLAGYEATVNSCDEAEAIRRSKAGV